MIKIAPDHDNRKVFMQIDDLDKISEKGLRNGLHDGGLQVRREIRRIIRTGPRTGRVYFFRGKRHKASAPGEPPANRSGKLARSASYRVRGPYQMEVGEKAFYANWLEEGTRKMKPRPHVIVAVENTYRDVEKSLTDAINRELGI